MNKREILNELSEILMMDLSAVSHFPKEYKEGFQCLYILKSSLSPVSVSPVNGVVTENTGNITTSSIGKIWSNQGLFPIIKDSEKSVFAECPFQWFAGYSSTSHFEYIYYLDNRDPSVKLYFRGEFGFYGEDRREEVSGNFRKVLDEFEKSKSERTPVELIFHVREFIKRQM